MYFFSPPPYFLFVAGLLAAIASGYAFSATLQQATRDWAEKRSSRIWANLQGAPLKVPFFGICSGVCVFLGSGMQIFGFPAWLAYAFGVPLTLLSALLVWTQLGRILAQLEAGGSKALDLDSF